MGRKAILKNLVDIVLMLEQNADFAKNIIAEKPKPKKEKNFEVKLVSPMPKKSTKKQQIIQLIQLVIR